MKNKLKRHNLDEPLTKLFTPKQFWYHTRNSKDRYIYKAPSFNDVVKRAILCINITHTMGYCLTPRT